MANCLLGLRTISVQTVALGFLKNNRQDTMMELKILSFGVVGLMVNMLDMFGKLAVMLLGLVQKT